MTWESQDWFLETILRCQSRSVEIRLPEQKHFLFAPIQWQWFNFSCIPVSGWLFFLWSVSWWDGTKVCLQWRKRDYASKNLCKEKVEMFLSFIGLRRVGIWRGVFNAHFFRAEFSVPGQTVNYIKVHICKMFQTYESTRLYLMSRRYD